MLNVLPLLYLEWRNSRNQLPAHSTWLLRTIGIAAISLLSFYLSIIIIDGQNSSLTAIAFITMLVLYPAGLYYGYRHRQLFYLCVIPLSVIIILTSAILRAGFGHGGDGVGALFLSAGFVIGSITLLVRFLISLNRQWHAPTTE